LKKEEKTRKNLRRSQSGSPERKKETSPLSGAVSANAGGGKRELGLFSEGRFPKGNEYSNDRGQMGDTKGELLTFLGSGGSKGFTATWSKVLGKSLKILEKELLAGEVSRQRAVTLN